MKQLFWGTVHVHALHFNVHTLLKILEGASNIFSIDSAMHSHFESHLLSITIAKAFQLYSNFFKEGWGFWLYKLQRLRFLTLQISIHCLSFHWLILEKMEFGKKLQFFRKGEKHTKISTKIKTTILSMTLNVLIGDSFEMILWNTFMKFYRLPEKCLSFRKFENCKMCSMEMNRDQLYWNSCLRLWSFLKMLQKLGNSSQLGVEFICYWTG